MDVEVEVRIFVFMDGLCLFDIFHFSFCCVSLNFLFRLSIFLVGKIHRSLLS